MTSLVTQQIIEQLKDCSHPPIILLDGAWGVGKTYLIEHELKANIESSKEEFGDYHYLSAYGMRNVTDFQDQVVSLFLSSQKEGSNYVTTGLQQVGNIARIFGADKSEAGLVQGVMSGLTGAVRQSTLQNLSNMTLILDDLERLSGPKIIADILGTCLRFAEHNKIKIIVVANASVFTDKSKIEKTFSDIVTLSRSTDELITILSHIYQSEFDPNIEESLRKSIEKFESLKFNINNLRVLQRIVNRIRKLKNRIKNIKNIDLPHSHQVLTQQIADVCLFAYVIPCNEKNFNEYLYIPAPWENKNLTASNGKNTSKNEQKRDVLNTAIRNIFNTTHLNKEIVHYCFTNLIPSGNDDELINKLRLPMVANPLDQLIKGYYFNLSEEEFKKGVLDLEELIFDGSNKDYRQWLAGCEVYFFLIDNKYLDKVKADELIRLKGILKQEKIIDPLTIGTEQFIRRVNIPDEFNHGDFKSLLAPFITKSEEYRNNSFSEKFYSNWSKTIYDGQKNYADESFLHNLNIDELCEHIANWKGADIIEFIGFIKSRYAISNAKDWYKEELPSIQKLIPLLRNKQSNICGKLKKGMLYELIKEFEKILKKLTA